MAGNRKAAFEAYYKANPEKLKGKSIDEAYAAMRRNVVATGNRAGKSSAGDDRIKNAIARRMEARGSNGSYNVRAFTSAMKKSQANKSSEGSLGEQWSRDKPKIKRFLFGPEDRDTSKAVRTDPRTSFKPPEKLKVRSAKSGIYADLERRYTGKGKMSEAQKNALERRLKKTSTKGGRQV